MHNDILDAYPFLKQIPVHILITLDLNSLYVPTRQEQTMLAGLSASLKKPVVIYRKQYTPQGAHLCKTIRSAELSHDQLHTLLACEANLDSHDKVLVAYSDPVELTTSFV